MRIGTRGSALALAQAEHVSGLLGGGELVTITTRGDRGAALQDKSRWVQELEDALSSGEIDLAVHSAKDVPGEFPDGLALLGSPPRAAAEDVLCGAASLEELPRGARVGTSSLRRTAQLRCARADLDVIVVRGNVDTRLRKLAEAQDGLSAIVLARAGLQRLGRSAEIGAVLDAARFLPAPGQGALVLEGRAQDERTRADVAAINNQRALACLLAERAVAHELSATCHTPLGAQAVPEGADGMRLSAWVGLPDGSAWVADELLGSLAEPGALGAEVAGRMRAVGAGEMLQRAEEMAGVGGV
jgi:hydroxymethylbilane synthase